MQQHCLPVIRVPTSSDTHPKDQMRHVCSQIIRRLDRTHKRVYTGKRDQLPFVSVTPGRTNLIGG